MRFHLIGIFYLFSIGLSLSQSYDSTLNLFSTLPKDPHYVDTINVYANALLRSSPPLTRKLSLHTAQVASSIGYTKGYARALVVTGNSYWTESIYELAQKYYLMAAREYESIQDSIGLGQVYNNLGEIHKKFAEYDQALTYLLLSVKFKKRDEETRAITFYNVAELYTFKGNWDLASVYVDSSLTVAMSQNNKRVIAFNYWVLGAIHSHNKKFSEALRHYQAAETIWHELNEQRMLIQTYAEIASLYTLLSQYSKAKEFINHAEIAAKSFQAPDLKVLLYKKMILLDSAQGNFKQALAHSYNYQKLKDSLFSLQRSEQISRMQTIYETELKEQENEKLKIEQARKESQLQLQQIILILIGLGLVSSTVFIFLLFRQRNQIYKTNLQLADKNDEIETQKEGLEMQAVALQKLNENLLELNASLGAEVESRTHQIKVQNQKLAEYLFINAHKLRAPIASILGLVELFKAGSQDDRELIASHLKACSSELDVIIHEINKTLESGIHSDDIPNLS
ncbi:MAG: hypothetical protein L0Y35_06185 [Flammeovirgaceae bacterium]|nr:hypothetical protein [Flammeovirgaceae bacterium]